MSVDYTNPDLNDYLKPGRAAWSDAYHNSPHSHHDDCCIVCGKRTVEGRRIEVILGGGGTMLIKPEDEAIYEALDHGYMGLWSVGPECGRDIPQEYRATPR
jgi:hypothetical protein